MGFFEPSLHRLSQASTEAEQARLLKCSNERQACTQYFPPWGPFALSFFLEKKRRTQSTKKKKMIYPNAAIATILLLTTLFAVLLGFAQKYLYQIHIKPITSSASNSSSSSSSSRSASEPTAPSHQQQAGPSSSPCSSCSPDGPNNNNDNDNPSPCPPQQQVSSYDYSYDSYTTMSTNDASVHDDTPSGETAEQERLASLDVPIFPIPAASGEGGSQEGRNLVP